MNNPKLLVFAGPNGSGKTTVTRKLPIIGAYINADDIKKAQHCSDLEAAKISTAIKETMIEKQKDFTFETVLSSDRNVDLIKTAKDCGYSVRVIFILTSDVNINISRVQNRVKNGGHDVPEEKIRSRYEKSLANISKLVNTADNILIYDNSGDVPELIAEVKDNKIAMFESSYWEVSSIMKLFKD